ncbi:acVLRF1 family peptidyl-tRNA hydrolase [Arthrobacter sp. LAPM80]|uniref:acVLRF1 family peptidyl-tRNA hydrolase n=1 Tax=Arthrobacter sp. LAPM80 TaxID=3141788 RepID=UPI00398AC83D
MNAATRTALVPASRLTGWLERFSAAHDGRESLQDTDDGVLLRMCDGAAAVLTPPWPDDGRPGRGADLLERLVSLASQERSMGLVLVRRAGFAVGVATAGKLEAHKVGTASARSRGGDAGAATVERAAAEAARIFAGHSFEYLATGGDRQLVESVLASQPLRKHAPLPRLAPLPVTDPKMDVLTRAAADFCAIRIRITDAGT